ncbi:MAG: NAD-dependent epimerase/dehydratase family protein [Myxococcales bacterium]|nr:NAD-dependent epimerase/dehydratase family protein [Myxococcales bacterium]
MVRRPSSPASVGQAIVSDYTNVDTLAAFVDQRRPAYVVHVAGATKGVTYADFQGANVRPTEALLEAFRRSDAPLRRFLYLSSLVSHGPSTVREPHDEGAEPRPIEHYGRSKLEAERAVEGSGLPFTILRPGGVYGPGDVDYFNLFKSAASGLNVYFGNRRRVFSKIYIDDMVEATLQAMLHPAAENRGYFVCDGAPVSWQDFQEAISAHAGRRVQNLDLPGGFVGLAALGGELLSAIDGRARLFNRQKAAMGRAEAWTCTPRALERDVGFQARVSLQEGVERSWKWYRERAWVPSLRKESA